jgi:hypothetical protein
MVLSFPAVDKTTILHACICNYWGITMESPLQCSWERKLSLCQEKCFYFFPITCRGECSTCEAFENPMELIECTLKWQCMICVTAMNCPMCLVDDKREKAQQMAPIPKMVVAPWCLPLIGLALYPKVGCCMKYEDMKPPAPAAAAATPTGGVTIQINTSGGPGEEEMW